MHLPPFAYRAWQRLFVAPKLEPLLRHDSYRNAATLCELGCGPGSNYPFLAEKEYLGVDIGEDYVGHARAVFGDRFLVGDVSAGVDFAGGRRFDVVLVHSVLHHLDDDQVVKTLRHARELVKPGGSLHVFDVVLPPVWTLAGLLARMDEGRHIRPWEYWAPLFEDSLGSYERQDFALRLAGVEAYRFFHLVRR